MSFVFLSCFILQLADAPAIAADVLTAKYRICPHTKAQYSRGNPCPCGHKHGKNRTIAVIENESADCNSDDDSERLRTPSFEAFVFTFSGERLLVDQTNRHTVLLKSYLPSGLFLSPPDTPS